MKAQEKGLNSKEGSEAAKAAMINSAKYTALFGVIAGIWDDARKTLDFTNDKYLEDRNLVQKGIHMSLDEGSNIHQEDSNKETKAPRYNEITFPIDSIGENDLCIMDLITLKGENVLKDAFCQFPRSRS